MRPSDDDLEIIDLNVSGAARNDFPEDVYAEDTTENLKEQEPEPDRKGKGSSKRRKTNKKRPGKRGGTFHIVITAGILLVLTLAGFLILRTVKAPRQDETENIAHLTEELEEEDLLASMAVKPGEGALGDKSSRPANEHLGSAVIDHILKAAVAVEDAYEKRPPEVTLTDSNRADFVKIRDCLIDSETGQIRVDLTSEGIPRSDDKFYYLFALNSYDSSIKETDEYITRIYKDDETSMSCALNVNSSISRLYQKFGVAVKENDVYTLISTPQYITNPEVLAKHSGVYMNPSSKKGILIDYRKINSGQLEDLGVNQAAINLHIGTLLGPSTNALYPTVYYTYNGKTYSFNYAVIAGFDNAIRDLTAKGISVTAILLNPYSSSHISLIHPSARSSGACPYYMFNAADEDGVETLAAVGSFLADRYSGAGYGRISNWVIANEINARKEWNYFPYTDIATYTAAYADGFRIFYNAIRSTSSSARVYISLDQQWNRDMKNNPDYDGKDVLDQFNSYISSHGNINWGLAYHPYNSPLTICRTWASAKNVTHTASSPMITMQNIEVLINYMKQSQYLNKNGEVRSIMITELGYTSSGKGTQELQAAAIAYAYYKVEHYTDIDGLLLNRQTDDATEIAQGLSTGVTTMAGAHKLSYDVFKYMDTDQMEEHTAFAKSLIGISEWSEIMR